MKNSKVRDSNPASSLFCSSPYRLGPNGPTKIQKLEQAAFLFILSKQTLSYGHKGIVKKAASAGFLTNCFLVWRAAVTTNAMCHSLCPPLCWLKCYLFHWANFFGNLNAFLDQLQGREIGCLVGADLERPHLANLLRHSGHELGTKRDHCQRLGVKSVTGSKWFKLTLLISYT